MLFYCVTHMLAKPLGTQCRIRVSVEDVRPLCLAVTSNYCQSTEPVAPCSWTGLDTPPYFFPAATHFSDKLMTSDSIFQNLRNKSPCSNSQSMEHFIGYIQCSCLYRVAVAVSTVFGEVTSSDSVWNNNCFVVWCLLSYSYRFLKLFRSSSGSS